jgi:hypothetical protein
MLHCPLTSVLFHRSLETKILMLLYVFNKIFTQTWVEVLIDLGVLWLTLIMQCTFWEDDLALPMS